MLFSNVSLDTGDSNTPGIRVAYLNKENEGSFDYLKLIEKKPFEIPRLIVNKFHPDLSITNLRGSKDLGIIKDYHKDQLCVILDSFRYKEYKQSGFVSALSLEDVDVIKLYESSDYYNTVTWDSVIFKVNPKKEFYIFAINDTLGQVKFLTIYKGYLRINTPYSIKKYLEELNQNIDIDNYKSWTRLK